MYKRQDKFLEQAWAVVEKVNALEPEIQAMTNEQLKAQTVKFKALLAEGKTLDDILVEAFATIREASKRVIGQRHFDVQLIGGYSLHKGWIAEMRTGEGKTLTATSAIYLNALSGEGAHLVTVNDYLARTHADWMGRIYDFLGLTVSCIQQQNSSLKLNTKKQAVEGDEKLDIQYLEPCSRREAYACDIVYGTNNEFGFDYLRDNMVQSKEDMAQRELSYAIVDEVDSILIDEARTPLIISAPDMESTDKYFQFSKLVLKLTEKEDYNLDEKMRAVTLTEHGIEKVEKELGVENIYTDRGITEVHHIEQALKAQVLFKKDRDYVVKDGEIVIIDEFTGRMMFGRRYSEGLHQAIEAKEGVNVQRESRTLATVSLQNYFRLYKKLAGMTGTAATEAEEFFKIYKLEVAVIPTNRPMVRQDLNDRIYKNEMGKFKALVVEVKERHKKGQPVLIGTVSIEKNELLAALLEQAGVPCQVLNAKFHEKEAHIIAQAGKVGAVTVATNMAGRGVDIILGGYPFNKEEYDKVVAAGGLCVLGTERHESRRIDNQLRGRAGRQGDPGLSQFYISMDDDLMRIFGSDRMKSLMTALHVPEDQAIESGMISKSIEQAQKKVEGNNFDMRKHLVDYDDVMNKQRETIYRKRRELLAEDTDSKQLIFSAITKEIIDLVRFHTQNADEKAWDLNAIYGAAHAMFEIKAEARLELDKIEAEAGNNFDDDNSRNLMIGYLLKLATLTYNSLEEQINIVPNTDGINTMRKVEKWIMLRSIDSLWIEHLETMEYMRHGINLRGYGQRDPLVEYKRESLRLFRDLLNAIDKQTVYTIFKVGVSGQVTVPEEKIEHKNLQFSAPSDQSSLKSPMAADSGLEARKQEAIKDNSHFDGEKVGRNDLCPCGSGKKFKKCHGK